MDLALKTSVTAFLSKHPSFPSFLPPSLPPSPPSLPSFLAEILLASCTHICRASDGESVLIDATKRKELENYITTLAKQSLRAIRYGGRK